MKSLRMLPFMAAVATAAAFAGPADDVRPRWSAPTAPTAKRLLWSTAGRSPSR
jgi:hypothetical protein